MSTTSGQKQSRRERSARGGRGGLVCTGGGGREEREIFEILEGQSRVVVADWDSQKKVLFVASV